MGHKKEKNSSTRRSGIPDHIKAGSAEYIKEWRKRNPKLVKKHNQTQRDRNPEKIKECSRNWKSKNKKHLSEYMKEYTRTEKYKKWYAAYVKKNKAQISARKREWYERKKMLKAT